MLFGHSSYYVNCITYYVCAILYILVLSLIVCCKQEATYLLAITIPEVY